jgi:hypothetical protein
VPLQDIEYKTLAGIFTGSAAAIYPNLALVGTPITWPFDIWLVSIQFSTSLTIFPASGNSNLGALVLTIGKQPVSGIAVSEGLASVGVHITAANSIGGASPLASPSSKVSVFPFGGCGKFMPNGQPVSLYGSADATSGNFLWSISSIGYRRA